MKEFLEHRDYYIEKGEIIFTEYYLLNRKQCCRNNCRHCPYAPKPNNTNKTS